MKSQHITKIIPLLSLLLTSVCSAADLPASTNAASTRERVFVEIKETGSRRDDHGREVTLKTLSALGTWPCQTTIDEKFFKAFVEPVKSGEEDVSFVKRCLEQKTLSPSGHRANSANGLIADLVFHPQKYPVRLGAMAEGDTKATITISWSAGGSYGVMGGPAIDVSKPACEVEFMRPDGKKKSFTFTPPEHSSYERGWPIVYWSEDIGSFISGLSKEFEAQKSAK